ncbi:MAG TPA: hypothetical protein VGE11_25715 [Pseudonocardia sp.]
MIDDDLAALALTAPARCGATRLVCVDGPSGAGKTQLAARLVVALGDPPLLHMDDLYPGWDGLAAGVALLRNDVVGPLAAGRPARYPRWDWVRSSYTEHHSLGTPALLVVEGVGAGAGAVTESGGNHTSLLVWLDAAEEVRYRRAMERDGATYAPHWARWAGQERAHFTADRTAERADVALCLR